MAITWDVQITNVNVDNERGDVSFTRTDSENPSAVESYTYRNTQLATQYRAGLLNTVWTAHQAAEAEATAVSTFLSTLEQAAKSNLEAREV